MFKKIQKQIREKLLYKICAIFMVLSLGPLIAVGPQLISTAQEYIRKEIVKTHKSIAEQFAYNIGVFMQNTVNLLNVAYRNESLMSLMDAYTIFNEVSFYTMEGERKIFISASSSNENKSLLEMDKVTEEIRNYGLYTAPIRRSAKGHPVMQLAVAVRKQAQAPVGFLLADIDLIELSDLMGKLKVGDTGVAYILTHDRQLIAHSDFKQVIENKIPEGMDSFLQNIPDKNESGVVEFQSPAGKYFGSYARLENLDWIILVQLPVREVYKVTKEMKNKIIFFLFIAASVTILLGFFFTNRIVKPIRILQAAMDKVAQGNLESRLNVKGEDEVAQLSRKFSWMTDVLREKSEQLLQSHKELEKWSKELEKRVDERTKELRETQAELIKKEQLAAIGQMSSVVGHELRNPLAVIKNSTHFLKMKLARTEDEKILKHLNFIELEVNTSNKIIEDILSFARSRDLMLQKGSINELLENILAVTVAPANIKIVRNLEANLPEFLFDKEELQQVFRNIINNGLQAMPDGGELMVQSVFFNENNFVDVKISDTGCGISRENLEKMFAPFFTTKSKGTGLGLSVVKKVIDRHKGSIEVQSEVGKGTTFLVRLPLNV